MMIYILSFTFMMDEQGQCAERVLPWLFICLQVLLYHKHFPGESQWALIPDMFEAAFS